MRDVSEDFKVELGRANYVTPTSYLELITMFQRLVTAKRIENSKTLSRYTVGLDKLQSSAQQVAGMQQELRVRNPISLFPYQCSVNVDALQLQRLALMFVCHDVSRTARFTSSVYCFKQQQPYSAFVFGMTPSLARFRCVQFGDGKRP